MDTAAKDITTSSVEELNETKPTENEIDENDKKQENKDEWVDLLGSGSIMKKIIREGLPDTKPQRLQKCRINYTCTLEDDPEVILQEEGNEIFLGDCDVIQGLDVAVALMNLNERCLLKIAPRLAYGQKGLPGKVPENATVVYDIELTAVEPEVEPESLSVKERKIIGNKKRVRGNWWYCRGENNLAIQCYRRALNYLDEVEGGIKTISADNEEEITDADLQELLEDRISVCNNMAAAQIKLESYDAALLSLQTVLRCQPNNVKALFRKAKVLRAKNDLTAALKCLQKAKDVAPNDQDVQKELNAINMLMQKQKGVERELARRMFNGPKKSDNNVKKGTSRKIGLYATVGATLALGAGVFAYRFLRV
ncbi:peptidyl-prolyl cis-trans isomerase FKBP8 [Aethina tumida]|uniref:peptidyl-prolyl cis-trans isomerase FKBP8 n=1 Tax=Aethina tumida TaxID=116153 RepID=UPI0021478B6C|nr:peptidyl-prolyl cis-trans isomerase FKBP8 [Aethina tumida]